MTFPIRFLPEDRTYVAQEPLELMLAAAACDIWVEQPCGSKTICGKCRVRVREGEAPVTAADQRLLAPDEIRDGWRLACQLTLPSAAVIEIPAVTRSVAAKPFGDAALFAQGFEPNIEKRFVELAPPSEEKQFADLDLIARALGREEKSLTADISLLPHAHQHLSRAGYGFSAVLSGDELIEIEPAQTIADCYGVAIDIGSTTLAAALVDLRTGVVLHAMSRLNPQVRYGADIISRIHFAGDHSGGSDQLHRQLLAALRSMLEDLADQADIAGEHIYAVTCAGNATMTHSAVGADITSLGQAPYVGLFTREWTLRAHELALPINKRALVRFLPMIRSHVGGDTVAAIMASALDQAEGWRLMIDLGTNSEVVIGSRRRMVATSTAAGPAFEGANIHHGMRAAPGAIDCVRISPDGRVVCKTVGNEPPRGLCGSGLVDAAAELLCLGVIAPSGYMRKGDELGNVPELLRGRCITIANNQAAVQLAGEVVITAQDIRQLQLVKGSIYAGVEILLQHLGIGVNDLEEVNIAGAFGNFLRKTSAQAIGLVPDLDPEKIKFIGNAAGVGARMALVDARARRRTIEISHRCEYVELAGHPDYQDAFCRAIPFPPPPTGQ